MRTQIHAANPSRTSSLELGAARLRSRISRQSNRGVLSRSAVRFNSSSSLFNSLWSPVRLDLLRTPLSRYRD